MSGVNLRVRVGGATDISSVERGEIIVTRDSVVRVNTTPHVVTTILAIPSLIGYLGTQGDTGLEGNVGHTGQQGSTGYLGDTGIQGFTGAQGYTGIGYSGEGGPTGSQGCTGAQGFAGIHGGHSGDGGITGATGSQGSGLTGSQGATGVTGFKAGTGSQGFAGVQGDRGDQGGYTGMQGSTGWEGSGPTGDTGLQGDTGLTGAQGAGYIGSLGTQGLHGCTGILGAQGSTGSQGAGTQGDRGETGFHGAQGVTGVQGSGVTGAQGERGETGAEGMTGSQGDQGDTGVQGNKGNGFEGSIGFTGEEGSTGVEGASDSTGDQGFTGQEGLMGFTGVEGVQGLTGITGSIGYSPQGDIGITGSQGGTGSQGDRGYMGSEGVPGDIGDSFAPTGTQGDLGFIGAQGYSGWQGTQGERGGADTGSQGFAGPQILTEGIGGPQGDTGAQGINLGYAASSLVNETTQLVGFAGGLFRHNSNVQAISTHLTVPILSTSNLTAATVFTQPPSVTPITYTTTSNIGSNTVFMIQNAKASYPISLSPPYLSAYFPVNTFTQVLAHPSGWVYLYSDSNLLYSTPSNYIYALSPDGILSNLSFNSPIYHMALDPLGNVFVSSSSITRYTVNPSTGELTSNASIQSPFPGARVYATAGYVYAYLSGATSNVFRYPNLLSNQTALSCYPGTLSFFSADPQDKILYSTTTTSNIYSYNQVTGATTQVTPDLSSIAYTPLTDPYTNTMFNSLPSSTSVQVTALDGTFSYPTYTYFRDFAYTPSSIVCNPLTSIMYACVGNSIQAIHSNAVYTLVGSSNPGNADGSNAQFNSPQALCLDTTGSTLYVADTGNSSIRQIALSNVSGLQLWLDAADPAGNGVVPANGTSIATWVDKSGNSRNASATGTNTYITSSLHGLPGIEFSGNTSNTHYFSSTIPPSTFQAGISIFIVFQANGQNDPQYCSPISRVGSNGGVVLRGSNITVLNSPPSTDTITYTTSLLPYSVLSPIIYSLSISPIAVDTLSNGVSYPMTSSTSGPSAGVYNVATLDSTCSNLYIGTDGTSGYLNGVVYEVLVYTTLSTAQRQQVEGYLAYKWGLLLQRPHPYYAINPVVSPLFMQSATVSTLVSGLSNPQGVACDSSNLYIADTGNHTIKRFTFATSAISSIGSNGISGSIDGIGSAARFNVPKGLTLSSDSSLLYVADSSNYIVRAISTSNLSTTVYMGQAGVKGFTASNFSAPTALTVNSNGVLYVTDTGNNSIVYANTLGIVYFLSITIPGIVSLYSIANTITSPNTIYGCDQNTRIVFSYNLNTAIRTNLYTLNNYAISIAVDTDLNTYVSTAGGSNSILRNGLAIPGTANIGNYGSILCIDKTNTYAYVYTFAQIYKVTLPNGPAVLLAGSPRSAYGYADGIGSNALFFQPGGLCIDAAGSNLYVCDTNNDVIRKINVQTSNVTTLVGVFGSYWPTAPIDGVGSNARLRYFTGINEGKSGLLYFTDSDAAIFNTTYIRTLDPVSLEVKTLYSIPGGNLYNYTICINSTETTLYFPAERGIAQNTLGYYSAVLAGSNAGYSNAIGTTARFNTPLGITFNDSTLIVVDSSNQMLRTVNSSSNATTYRLSTDYQLRYMQNLSMSSNSFYTMGNILVDSTTYSALISIPFASYPSTTYTFSNLGSTTQIQNTTGRPVTISVPGQTVTNPVLPSTANASYIATLFNTGSGYTFV